MGWGEIGFLLGIEEALKDLVKELKGVREELKGLSSFLCKPPRYLIL